MFASYKQYFFSLLTSLEMQKRLKQTLVYDVFIFFVWKETTHNPLKVAAAETLFSCIFVIGTTCFNECFYFMW